MIYRLPLPPHIAHHYELSASYGFHRWSKPKILTFLVTKIHAKAFTFIGVLDFQMKFPGIEGTKLVEAEIATKKLTEMISRISRTKLSR